MKTQHSIGVVIIRDDKILLVKHGEGAAHETGTYGLPAGRPGENEEDIKAAVRELEEETGFVCNEKNLIEYLNNLYHAEIRRKNGEMITFSFKIFICTSYKGELKFSDETKPEWAKISDMNKLNLLPNTERIVNDVRSFLNQNK